MMQIDGENRQDSFKLVPAIIMGLLFLAFILSNIYVLVASWE